MDSFLPLVFTFLSFFLVFFFFFKRGCFGEVRAVISFKECTFNRSFLLPSTLESSFFFFFFFIFTESISKKECPRRGTSDKRPFPISSIFFAQALISC